MKAQQRLAVSATNDFSFQKVNCVRSSAVIVNHHEMPSAEGHSGKTNDHNKEASLARESFDKATECEMNSGKKVRWTVAGNGTERIDDKQQLKKAQMS